MRALSWISCLLAAFILLAAGTVVVYEQRLAPKERLSPEDAFLRGDIGLEIAPLKYLLVMDDPRLGGDAFMPNQANAAPGAWFETFGFIAHADKGASRKPPCAESGLGALPFGFTLSRKLPGSGWPFPVTFGGLACAACHSDEYVYAGKRHIVAGSGNHRLDIIAFGEALKNAVQNPKATAETILTVYEERCGAPKDFGEKAARFFERLFLQFWLNGIREELKVAASKYDLAAAPNQLWNADALPAGPSRTRAFRSVTREALDLPGEGNFAFSKIPSTFLQATKTCGQYDGSICDHVARSQIAAYSSGASVAELSQPDVVHNIREAAQFTLDLKPSGQGAAFAAMFPGAAPGRDVVSQQAAERGRTVYKQYCEKCHGSPTENGGWTFPQDNRPLRAITQLTELGTDPIRIEFRYAALLPDAIWLAFPLAPGGGRDLQSTRLELRIAAASDSAFGEEATLWQKLSDRFEKASRRHPLGHPLAFPDGTLIYDENPETRGYQNNALPGVFLSAPYLHNASVPNLAQLLHLERRPAQFCRGGEPYDPSVLGHGSPRPGFNGCPPEAPWLFDAAKPGNSNAGHDYPWSYAQAQRPENRAALQDLLEYLKTF